MLKYWFVAARKVSSLLPKQKIRAVESILEIRSLNGKWTRLCIQGWCLTEFFLQTARSCFSIDAREDLQDTTSENLDPTFDPLIYDRKQPKGKRWRQALADTDIARVYRSVALGLPDGRVWVAGSNNIEPAKTNVEYHFTPQSAGLNTFLLYTYSNRQSDLWCPMCQKCWPMGKNTAWISISTTHCRVMSQTHRSSRLHICVLDSVLIQCIWASAMSSLTISLKSTCKLWKWRLLRTLPSSLLGLLSFTFFEAGFSLKEHICMLQYMKMT